MDDAIIDRLVLAAHNVLRKDGCLPELEKALAAYDAHRQRAGEGPILDAPARVGNTRFGKGVKWSTVIGCAQRAAKTTPANPEVIAAVLEACRHGISDPQCPFCDSARHAEDPATVRVPREPTEAMIGEGARSIRCDIELGRKPQPRTLQRAARNAYVTMLSAAKASE